MILILPTYSSRMAFVAGFKRFGANERLLEFGTKSATNIMAPIATMRLMATKSGVGAGKGPKSSRLSPKSWSSDPNILDDEDDSLSGYKQPVIQWYPGHIAKAERQLKESFMRAVDVVVEVRDARIPKATSHPKVDKWCAGRPRLVVLTHVDLVPKSCQRDWLKAYKLFGAEHYKSSQRDDDQRIDDIDGQILNQAQQAERERRKYRKADDDKKKDKGERDDDTNKFSYAPVQDVMFVNAKEGGQDIVRLKDAISKAGAHVQERRARRGLRERALRVGILGYPNVGKSALINRLLNRKRARSANTPGVTRSLQWIRVNSDDVPSASGRTGSPGGNRGKEFELLDSPGIIPMSFLKDTNNDEHAQSDALLLAACNCIGDQAYDNQEVATYLNEWLLCMWRLGYGEQAAPQWPQLCEERYRFNPLDLKESKLIQPNKLGDGDDDNHQASHVLRTGQDVLYDVADNTCQGDPEDASRKILQDFRTGRLGPICLQLAPRSRQDPGQVTVLKPVRNEAVHRASAHYTLDLAQNQERAEAARRTAEEMGLELPPAALQAKQQGPSTDEEEKEGAKDKGAIAPPNDVGKGLFDGW